MKRNLRKLLGGALLFSLTMSLTSCEDILGHWEKPSPNPITPGTVTPTVEEVIKYGFKVTDLNGTDLTGTVNSLKMSTDDGPIAEAEVSGGKITIKVEKLSGITSAIDFWFEAEIGGKPYIAKVNINPTTLSPESDKTLEMATLGDVILADGTFAVSTTAGTKVAMIAYVGSDACEAGDAPYNHGLALALKDESSVTRNWGLTDVICLGTQFDDSGKFNDLAGISNTTTLFGDGHTHVAAIAARQFQYNDGVAAGTHPDGTSAWFLPSAGQWNKMVTAAGDYTTLKTNANLQTQYWSSTEVDASAVWCISTDEGSWSGIGKGSLYRVRACLAF